MTEETGQKQGKDYDEDRSYSLRLRGDREGRLYHVTGNRYVPRVGEEVCFCDTGHEEIDGKECRVVNISYIMIENNPPRYKKDGLVQSVGPLLDLEEVKKK